MTTMQGVAKTGGRGQTWEILWHELSMESAISAPGWRWGSACRRTPPGYIVPSGGENAGNWSVACFLQLTWRPRKMGFKEEGPSSSVTQKILPKIYHLQTLQSFSEPQQRTGAISVAFECSLPPSGWLCPNFWRGTIPDPLSVLLSADTDLPTDWQLSDWSPHSQQ